MSTWSNWPPRKESEPGYEGSLLRRRYVSARRIGHHAGICTNADGCLLWCAAKYLRKHIAESRQYAAVAVGGTMTGAHSLPVVAAGSVSPCRRKSQAAAVAAAIEASRLEAEAAASESSSIMQSGLFELEEGQEVCT